MAKRKTPSDDKPREKREIEIQNRRARHQYHILEKVECGIELVGTEVKSIRAGQIKLDEAFARIRGGEVWLIGANIAPYANAAEGLGHEPTRDRKLLLRRAQIAKLETHVKQKGKTLVPLRLYFHRGWAKIELGVATGKQAHDKRQDLRKKDHQREMARAMSRRKR